MCSLIFIAIISIVLTSILTVNARVVKVGAIFENERLTKSFLVAIEDVNRDPNVLPGIKLEASINMTKPLDAFDNLKAAQYLIQQGVVAIVGPMRSSDVKYTQPYFSGFHIPQFAPVATDPTFTSTPANFPYLVRMSPSDTIQCQALAGIMKHYNWSQFALLVSKDDYGINGVLALKDEAYKRGWIVVAHEHFEPVSDPNSLDVRKQLKWIRQTGTRIVVLNCYLRYSRQILKQAGDLGMTTDWAWIITDAQTGRDWQTLGGDFVLNQFYGVMGTRLAFGEGSRYKEVAQEWKSHEYGELDVVTGKCYDAVLALASALHHMTLDGYDVSGDKLKFEFGKGSVKPWRNGANLMKYIKKVRTSGIMNDLEFIGDGSPTFQEFDIVNLGRTGFVKVGKWTPSEGVVMFPEKPVLWLSQSLEAPTDRADTVENISIRVVAVIQPPFVEEKVAKTGEIIYTGFCIELLDRLQQDMKFRYRIEVLPSNQYGSWDVFSQKWNGIIEHLIERKADLAIGPLSVSSQRQIAVDFTQPFMHLGLSILIENKVNVDYKMFSFLKPFNTSLWLAIVAGTILVGFFLWLHATFSPRGYHGRIAQSRDQNSVRDDHWSTKDCLRLFESAWSSFSYTVGQGADVAHPQSTSGRVIIAFWWFAMLIISASYTANLASFLVTDVFETPINSLEDLAAQTKIKYGCAKDSHTMAFFQMSRVPTYAKMWAFMKRHDTLVENVTEGIRRARKGGYAFISESAVLDYYTEQRPCNTLTTIGRVFGKFGYGFGLPKNSPFTHQFSVKILELRQKGFLKLLRERWLQGVCETTLQESSDTSFTGDVLVFKDMAGAFYAVFFGLAFSLIMLLVELTWAAYKDHKQGQTFSLLQGFRDRVVKSWKNKRGKSLSRYKYNSKADTNWSIALQQLQTLLPKKEGVEDKPKIGNRDELQAKRGLQQNYDATEHVNQHKSTPSAYI